jgi:PIN domain
LWKPGSVILRSGVSAARAAEDLSGLQGALQTPRNLRDEPIPVPQGRYREAMSAKINAYLDWAQNVENRARQIFADTDLVDGLFANRYWHIAGLNVGSPYGTRIIHQELDHQDARFAKAIETLKEWQKLGARPGTLLALDTNTFLQCRPYNEIPWTELAGTATVRLVLTMPVLDEIEAKKQGSNTRLKKRARKILPRIDKAFGDEGHDFFQVERDGKPMRGVTLEILRDPPDRRRATTDMDAEFLDRCEFLQSAAGRPVTVVTADTGMKNRVRGRLGDLNLRTVPDKYWLPDTEQDDPERGTRPECWLSQQSGGVPVACPIRR